MSIRSYNFRGHLITAVLDGTNYVGKIVPELTVGSIYINDTEGLYTDGKGNEQRVSFVEVDTEGNQTKRYLWCKTGENTLSLAPLPADSDPKLTDFKKNATFVVVEPKAGKKEDGFVSYQWCADSTKFLRHSFYVLKLFADGNNTDTTFKEDATFKPVELRFTAQYTYAVNGKEKTADGKVVLTMILNEVDDQVDYAFVADDFTGNPPMSTITLLRRGNTTIKLPMDPGKSYSLIMRGYNNAASATLRGSIKDGERTIHEWNVYHHSTHLNLQEYRNGIRFWRFFEQTIRFEPATVSPQKVAFKFTSLSQYAIITIMDKDGKVTQTIDTSTDSTLQGKTASVTAPLTTKEYNIPLGGSYQIVGYRPQGDLAFEVLVDGTSVAKIQDNETTDVFYSEGPKKLA